MGERPKNTAAHSLRPLRREPAVGVEQFHRIYEPEEVHQAIRQLVGNATAFDDSISEDGTVETPEDRNRLQVLRGIAADPRGPRRRSIVGNSAMVQRINALAGAMPHFVSVIGLVARAAIVSARTATPLRVPPLLMLGDAGVGKTFFARRLGEAILGVDHGRSTFNLIPLNVTDPFRIRGQNTGWRGARMGRIAETLFASPTNAVLFVDEFDKPASLSSVERPHDVWLSLLEPENSRCFRDDFLEIELRADHILWLASANDVTGIPTPVLDRFLVVDIAQPSREQLSVIVAGIYATCRESYGGCHPEHLADEVVDELVRHNLRRASQLLRLAIGYAAEDGRLRLRVEDVRAAQKISDYTIYPRFRQQIGFVPQPMR